MLTPFICTGSKSIDWLLGGGVRKGMVTMYLEKAGLAKLNYRLLCVLTPLEAFLKTK